MRVSGIRFDFKHSPFQTVFKNVCAVLANTYKYHARPMHEMIKHTQNKKTTHIGLTGFIWSALCRSDKVGATAIKETRNNQRRRKGLFRVSLNIFNSKIFVSKSTQTYSICYNVPPDFLWLIPCPTPSLNTPNPRP